MRPEPSVFVKTYGLAVGGEDVEVDGPHLTVVAGGEVGDQRVQHERGDPILPEILDHAQRQNVADLSSTSVERNPKPATTFKSALSEVSKTVGKSE